MAFFAQTWERIIQEYCIADLIRTYCLSLGDIIPSQDGFMPLKEVIRNKNISVADLFDRFNCMVLKKFGLDIKWSEKGFDEAIEIKPSDIVPIDITLHDLELGEVKIAEKIYPALKNKLIYSSKTNLWYYTDKQNIWCKTKYANEYLISKTIQYYIKGLIDKYWEQYRLAEKPEEKKEIKKDIDEATKYFNSVGKSSYVGQTAKYLRTLLTNNIFQDKLDNTGGKIVFADGIFDLKTGEFSSGIKRDDYVSFTLSINYPPDFDNKKMATLRDTLKKILNWNDAHLEYYLGVLGYAFCGDAHLEKSIYYIVDGTEGGRGDNGKTFFFDVLTH
jgi:phage/plasmid-associated DNA primase